MGRGLLSPPSVPLNPGIVSGHLLCAADEFPIVGQTSVFNVLKDTNWSIGSTELISDFDLFGSKSVYREALENLLDRGAIEEAQNIKEMKAYVKHPVSLRKDNAILNYIELIFTSLFSNQFIV